MWQQTYTPNFNAPGRRGWCQEYIDNAGGVAKTAPPRVPSAQEAGNVEQRGKRLKANQSFPVGVWVVAFWAISTGPYKGLGHVAFLKKHSNGKLEIRDSEVRAGARAAYTSLDQVRQWFGSANQLVFRGWSTHCSGRQYAKYVEKPKTPAQPKRIAKKGTATLVVNGLNVRDQPSTAGKVVAVYKYKGEKFNYDSYVKANGYTWLSYVSWTGKRRYVAQASKDGKTKYVKGGV